jgi:hypothetical protein
MLLTYLGYYVHLGKTALVPHSQQRWLGFVVDLAARTFRVPEEKLTAILGLVTDTLRHEEAEVGVFRSLVGKLVSLAPAVPGALLFTRRLFDALSAADRGGASQLALTAEIRSELGLWLGLRGWHGTRRWRSERHLHVRINMATDSSGHAWGGWFRLPDSSEDTLVGDVWTDAEMTLDIGSKEMFVSGRPSGRCHACRLLSGTVLSTSRGTTRP